VIKLSAVALLNNLPEPAEPIFALVGALFTDARAHKGAAVYASVIPQLAILFSP
jgi:hypothetical protein